MSICAIGIDTTNAQGREYYKGKIPHEILDAIQKYVPHNKDGVIAKLAYHFAETLMPRQVESDPRTIAGKSLLLAYELLNFGLCESFEPQYSNARKSYARHIAEKLAHKKFFIFSEPSDVEILEKEILEL